MNIHLVSLGCDKNLVDSEFMLGLIQNEGYILTSLPEEAQVIIINTCGFIMDATQESIDTILEMSSYKEEGSCKALIVTGCMAQRYRDEIFDQLPEVDAVVGVGDYDAIGQVIRDAAAGEKVKLVSEKGASAGFSGKRVLTSPSHFAYLKIAEGCDNHCTYCTIPSIRGAYRSRTLESLLEESVSLVRQGVQELILVAQDTSLYGKDLYGEPRLHELLNKLSQIPDLVWIRVLYCYPEHIYPELIQEIARNTKVCKYLDMPVQHSDDKILKLMGRKSSREKLSGIIKNLRESVPGIALRTTLIVGFPSETKDDFKGLKDFVTNVGFDKLGAFAYSREEGTPAAKLPGQVDDKEKQRRYDEIMLLQQKISNEKNSKKHGEVIEVMVDGYLPDNEVYCGRSQGDCYEIDGMVYFPCDYQLNSGDLVKVKITGHSDYDLYGEIC